ncbi:hypothetical protein [Lysobacter sp. Root604]|uniref:hypothetical protein n=2 Tax=unclassified Lysobacter TaxID=2635362 RepID=UPI0006FAF2CA|nr:hypothetical protein [Lysobacter sp. Root604]KRA14694.1 hypothetical protein ASD69_20405 [Lysobacter sp. Root604]
MKRIALIALIAAAHIAFLYGCYGARFFGLPLSYNATMAVWLGVSTIAAGIAYARAAAGLAWFSGRTPLRHLFAIAAAGISLYAGVFWAFNAFGT